GFAGLIAVSVSADDELVVSHARVGVVAATPRVHPTEPAQVLDVHGLGHCRLNTLVDDDLGSGKITADVDRPGPLPLPALYDVEIPIVTVHGHCCRAAEVGWGLTRACGKQGTAEGRCGGHDSLPHEAPKY